MLPFYTRTHNHSLTHTHTHTHTHTNTYTHTNTHTHFTTAVFQFVEELLEVQFVMAVDLS